MLRDIYVIKNQTPIYHIQFGSSSPWEELAPIIKLITSLSQKKRGDSIDQEEMPNYNLTYLFDVKYFVLFLFVSDFSDPKANLVEQIKKVRSEFITMYENLIDISPDPKVFASFNPVAEMIHQNLRPKISIVGFPGVGKTTITKLIRAEEIPLEHVPTVTGDIVAVKIGKLYINLWDFAGQEQYSFLWPDFLQNSDAVLLITDSTLQNIDKSKFFLDLTKKEVPFARLGVIANKQDLPDALDSKKIEKILNVATYDMIAIDPNNRAKMIHIIAELLNISTQISPLIRPLIDRDKAVEEAESLLLDGNFQDAIEKFKQIAALCRELGDNKLSLEFTERAKLIESQLYETPKSHKLPSPPPSETSKTLPNLAIPEIPADSKPLHSSDEQAATSTSIQQTKLEVSSLNLPLMRPGYNLIDRNIDNIILNNYLQFEFKKYPPNTIPTPFSEYPPTPLSELIKKVKHQMEPNPPPPLFPKVDALETAIQLLHPPANSATETRPPSNHAIENSFQHKIKKLSQDSDTTIPEKISLLKQEISSIDDKLEELNSKLQKSEITPKEATKLSTELRNNKRFIQNIISDLNIQKLKNFGVARSP
ncbi:MAG: GTP-binding protein [Promethearchaeota archaeon]|nr:MAG: GTP-binding protein [Candidatus Lokiarchaeota archaeon]